MEDTESVNTRNKIGKLSGGRRKEVKNLKRNLARAQRLVRRHVRPGTSLVDELIAERREAGPNE